MKKTLAIPFLFLLALPLGGCPATNNVGSFLSAVTTTITNPITTNDIYALKNGYAAAAQLAVDYRTKCYSAPYATLMADPVLKTVCQNRRSVVRAIQKYKAVAYSAVVTADTFVKNNPTVNAASVISQAWNAVNAFRNAVPSVK